MKIFIFTLCIALFFNVKIYSKNIGGFSVTMGISFPTGNYKSTSYSDSKSITPAFALNGQVFDLTYRKELKKIGFLFQINSTTNHIGTSEIFKNDIQTLPSNASNITGSCKEISPYKLFGIFLGGFYKIIITNKINFQPKAAIGVFNTEISKWTETINWVEYPNSNCSSTYTIYSGKSISFGYQFGCDFFYKISSKIDFIFSLNYFSSKSNKDVTCESLFSVNNTSISDIYENNLNYKFEMLNTNFGLKYNF
jgi:hypothetical protein